MERLTPEQLDHVQATFTDLRQSIAFLLLDSMPSTLTVYQNRALNDCIMVLAAVAELRVWRAQYPRATMGDFAQN